MPHVLYAVLALALIGLASLGQHHSERHEQTRAIRTQLEAAALSVGTEVHEGLAVLPFDAIETTSPSLLTPEAGFGPGLTGGGLADATDVDDVHGVSDTIVRRLTDPDTGAQRPIRFTVELRVRYVRLQDGELAPSGGERTLTKEVDVLISSPAMASPARLTRTYSPLI